MMLSKILHHIFEVDSHIIETLRNVGRAVLLSIFSSKRKKIEETYPRWTFSSIRDLRGQV